LRGERDGDQARDERDGHRHSHNRAHKILSRLRQQPSHGPGRLDAHAAPKGRRVSTAHGAVTRRSIDELCWSVVRARWGARSRRGASR
jgi:hypothetical protein